MFALMLVDTPDDRYRDHQSGTPWRRVLRLIAAAVACVLVGAFLLPWVGFVLDIGAVVLVLLAVWGLDDLLVGRAARKPPWPARVERLDPGPDEPGHVGLDVEADPR